MASFDPFFTSQLTGPKGLISDNSGNFYVANFDGNNICKISSSGVVSVYCDNTSGLFNGPSSLVFDSVGNLYVSNTNNSNILIIPSLGVVSVFVADALLSSPTGLAIDVSGKYIRC